MTKQELLEKLAAIPDGNPQQAHIDADDLLIEFINDEEVAKAYERILKWFG